jgi:putative membrane protein
MTTNKWLSLFFITLLMTFGLAACQRSDEQGVEASRDLPNVTPAEQEFSMKVMQSNMAEIEMARLAQEKSENGDIKDYAGMLEKDHGAANADMIDFAKDHNISQPGATREALESITRLKGLSGAEFDREFINMMVENHQKAVTLYRDQQQTVQNGDLKEFVDDVLPKIEGHLRKAQELQSTIFSAPPSRS